MVHEIKAIIADDEPLARETVKAYLESYANVTILRECVNGLDAAEAINSLKPDLVFLDVEMPELNGFEVLKEIDPGHTPAIIFTTAYDKYALKAFEANAVDYLLKPFTKPRFDTSMEKSTQFILGASKQDSLSAIKQLISSYDQLKNANNETPRFITRILVKEHKKYFFVKPEEVYWFEASGDYVILHKEKTTHWLNESLTNLESRLDPSQFIRVHRSSILNINYILNLQPHLNGEFYITLKNNERLKLSRNYKDKIRQLFAGLNM